MSGKRTVFVVEGKLGLFDANVVDIKVVDVDVAQCGMLEPTIYLHLVKHILVCACFEDFVEVPFQ